MYYYFKKNITDNIWLFFLCNHFLVWKKAIARIIHGFGATDQPVPRTDDPVLPFHCPGE